MSVFKSIAAKAPLNTHSVRRPTTKATGDSGEERALEYLVQRGLMLVTRNFKTPGRGGGEVDLVMRTPDGTLVFVEVRQRKNANFGGAAASISATKRRRIVFAAQHYLSRLARMPPCRFDVVSLQGQGPDAQIEWLQAAFDAS
jgi:putative endonuclease